MQKIQAKLVASALALFFLLAGFAPGFSSAVDLQESLWLAKHYEAGVSTRKMLVRASHMARRSLRTKTPSYPPSPISQRRTSPGRPGPTPFFISEKVV